jgi:hypothetical protein
LEIFTALEEENLFLIRCVQEAEEGIEDTEHEFAQTRTVTDKQVRDMY